MVSKASEDLPERAGQAGHHHQPVAGQGDVDALQIMLARAADPDLLDLGRSVALS
jgi:hypothetical protein